MILWVVIWLYERVTEKDLVENGVDLELALRAADAITDFLDTRLEKPLERYMAARLVCILYEETLACSLVPELEGKLRDFAKKTDIRSLETSQNTQ
jgi:hypothetical protein